MNHSHGHRVTPGFTIVELLIVVVVIAILAAITIIAYNGIQTRATESAMKQELKTSASILETDKIKSGSETYPASPSAANDGKGLKVSDSNSLQYTRSGSGAGMTFCLSITSTKSPSVFNYSSTQGSVQSGYCPGHSGAVMTTLASGITRPADVAIDSSGNVYTTDDGNHTIRRITPSGTVTTIAGTGVAGYANNTTGTSAQFADPAGIDINSAGTYLYVADSGNNSIRRVAVAAPHAVTTIAGTGSATAGYLDHATGTSAQFNHPYGIVINSSGVLYVSDAEGHRIRSISSSGAVTTLAGSTTGIIGATGSGNGQGAAARFNSPHGMDIDASGNIYVADNANHQIRRITPTGDVTTIAGSTDGYTNGPALSSQFSWPEAVAIAPNGVMYIADSYNSVIRSLSSLSSGTTSTVVGQQWNGGFSDGTGASAQINYPWGLDVGSDGVVYIADTWNNRIRKVQIP